MLSTSPPRLGLLWIECGSVDHRLIHIGFRGQDWARPGSHLAPARRQPRSLSRALCRCTAKATLGSEVVMSAYLEVWGQEGTELVPLDEARVAVGRDPSNDLALKSDRSVSQLHAVLQRYPSGWSVRDLGSTHGTFVNGERIWGERRLRQGDELRVGQTRLVFRERGADVPSTQTDGSGELPELTRRERDVLLALCRPVLMGQVFTEPASIREMAEALVLTESAVRQHLLRLSDKFGVSEQGERRRSRLANEAVNRGAVSLADLRERKRS